jgi:hypothetical protein
MSAKYIIFDEWQGHIFEPMLDHADEAKTQPNHTPTSAGFCQKKVGGTGLICFGESNSLKLRSKDGDADILNKMLGFTMDASKG